MSDTEKKKVSPEFVTNVKKYLEVDNKLRQIKEEVRKIKEKTKSLDEEKKHKEEYILSYLQSTGEDLIDLPDGKLKRNVTKSQPPLKKEFIQQSLAEIIGDAAKALAITDQIIKNRPTVERVTLKRTVRRAKNGKNDDVE